MSSSHLATWSIAAAAIIGVVTRPRNWSEAWWAVSGAVALVTFSLVSPRDAGSAILKGSDVYLFLIGMMLLAEIARREGLFDWLAQFALRHARGSGKRLCFQVYVAGTIVTIFLSNVGLFVLVQAVEGTGAIAALSNVLQQVPGPVSGSAVALASNLINNLPMGLICATAVGSAHLSTHLTGALLIGVDLGPNLSITGSLATILWLIAIRREGENVTAGQFLRVGCFVMPLSLLATLGVYNLLSST